MNADQAERDAIEYEYRHPLRKGSPYQYPSRRSNQASLTEGTTHGK